MVSQQDWITVPKQEDVPEYSVFTKPIVISQQDKRGYRLITLSNGLRAMLVHDSITDTAGAALRVAVGHMSDPDDVPGLAHFCEHLSFMGTASFPEEDGFMEFLKKNHGASNAYTASMDTAYYFKVGQGHLSPALERFSAFFHCPLFSASSTTREINAVNSENAKNKQNDPFRIFQVNKHLCKEGHPWNKFGTGNRETLTQAARDLKAKAKLNDRVDHKTEQGAPQKIAAQTLSPPQAGSVTPLTTSSAETSPVVSRALSPVPSSLSSGSESESDPDGGFIGRETRRRVMEWWSEQYCAERMILCVVGRESLDELAGMVSKLFSPVLNHGRDPLPEITDHPFGPNELGTLVSVKTVQDFYAIETTFPIPDFRNHWRYKPFDDISHLVGHEGPGSLHSYLKDKGWCVGLSSGVQSVGRGFSFLKCTIVLTQEGFRNYRAAMLALFNYLTVVRSHPSLALYHEENTKLRKIKFHSLEKKSPDAYALALTSRMEWPVPPELTIAGPSLLWDWDKDGPQEREMREILDTLRVGKARSVLMARGEEHDKLASGEWQKEPWYQTEYRVTRLDDEFVKEAEGPNGIKELFLPRPNQFIPTNLDVEKRGVVKPTRRPHLVRETPLSTLWHKKDDCFWVPKALASIEIRSPVANESVRSAVLNHLFASLVEDSLAEYAYDAQVAGLNYSFSSIRLGVKLTVFGYNDKLSVLLQRVLEKAKNLVVREDRLKVMKEDLEREWKNHFLGNVWTIATDHMIQLFTHHCYSLEDLLKEVPTITQEEVQNHIAKLFRQVYMRMLVTGNICQDEAIRIAELTENIISASPIPPLSVVARALLPEKVCNAVWRAPVPNPKESNSCLTYSLYIGPSDTPRARVLCSLLTQVLSQPAFNTLRTKEQLGYAVFCSLLSLPGREHVRLAIVVQSERGPTYLEQRVDNFLRNMEEHIANMEDAAFQEHKRGLISTLRENWKSLREEAEEYWRKIVSTNLDFESRWEDADYVPSVTKEDVLDLFRTRVHPSSPERSKFSIHLVSQLSRPVPISHAAAQAFESLVAARGLTPINGGKLPEDIPGQPTGLDAFVAHWTEALGNQTQAPELLAEIPALAEKYPAEDEYKQDVDGAVYIPDIEAYKQTLTVSDSR